MILFLGYNTEFYQANPHKVDLQSYVTIII